MENFDDFLTPGDIKNFDLYLINQYACYMRLELTEFLLRTRSQSLTPPESSKAGASDTPETKKADEYFDLTQFFKKIDSHNSQQLKNIQKTTQQLITDLIVDELKHKGWGIGTIFGGTGLVICSSDENLDQSVWSTAFDFVKL